MPDTIREQVIAGFATAIGAVRNGLDVPLSVTALADQNFEKKSRVQERTTVFVIERVFEVDELDNFDIETNVVVGEVEALILASRATLGALIKELSIEALATEPPDNETRIAGAAWTVLIRYGHNIDDPYLQTNLA